MHHAPSVSYPVGRSSWAGVLLFLVWMAGVAASAAWLASGAPGWAPLAIVPALAATGGAAAWAWWRQPAGLLAWDGAHWTLASGPSPGLDPGALEVALDLQALLLVRWSAGGRGSWLWLEKRRLPTRWDALRRAVYSPAEPDPASAAEPPSA
jgi:toxin CptA